MSLLFQYNNCVGREHYSESLQDIYSSDHLHITWSLNISCIHSSLSLILILLLFYYLLNTGHKVSTHQLFSTCNAKLSTVQNYLSLKYGILSLIYAQSALDWTWMSIVTTGLLLGNVKGIRHTCSCSADGPANSALRRCQSHLLVRLHGYQWCNNCIMVWGSSLCECVNVICRVHWCLRIWGSVHRVGSKWGVCQSTGGHGVILSKILWILLWCDHCRWQWHQCSWWGHHQTHSTVHSWSEFAKVNTRFGSDHRE